MKRNHLLFVSLFAVAVFSSFSKLTDWVTYKSQEGKYKVLMPASPQEQSQKVQSAVGELTMHMAMLEAESETDDNLLYMTAYSEYPADKINSDMSKDMLEKFFKGAAEGGAKKMNGTVTSITESAYKEYPARNIIIEANVGGMDMQVTQKIILVKNKFYMLQTFSLKEKGGNADSKKFIESFSLDQ